jgi:hypothetical protein
MTKLDYQQVGIQGCQIHLQNILSVKLIDQPPRLMA